MSRSKLLALVYCTCGTERGQHVVRDADGRILGFDDHSAQRAWNSAYYHVLRQKTNRTPKEIKQSELPFDKVKK